MVKSVLHAFSAVTDSTLGADPKICSADRRPGLLVTGVGLADPAGQVRPDSEPDRPAASKTGCSVLPSKRHVDSKWFSSAWARF